MSSREIVLWLDDRWYDAISRELKDETLEERLEAVLDELCNALPEQEYSRISQEIWQERMRYEQEQDAAKRYAAYRIIENGETHDYQEDRGREFLDMARLLRSCLREGGGAETFCKLIPHAAEINAQRFDELVQFRLDNTGKVSGAFELNFDNCTCTALNSMDGWQTFRMEDVSAAVYHALRKQSRSEDEQWRIFLDKLDGKALIYESQKTYGMETESGPNMTQPM